MKLHRLLRAAAERRVDARVLQPFEHGRIVERDLDRGGELVDDGCGVPAGARIAFQV